MGNKPKNDLCNVGREDKSCLHHLCMRETASIGKRHYAFYARQKEFTALQRVSFRHEMWHCSARPLSIDSCFFHSFFRKKEID